MSKGSDFYRVSRLAHAPPLNLSLSRRVGRWMAARFTCRDSRQRDDPTVYTCVCIFGLFIMRIEAWAKHTHRPLFFSYYFSASASILFGSSYWHKEKLVTVCAHLCCCYYYGVGGRSNAFDIGSRPLDGLGRVFAVHIILLLSFD